MIVAANAKQKGTMEYSNGNLTKSVDAKGFNYSYKYDSKHNMTEATSQGGMPITYDAIGNPLTYRGFTLTWQNGRQLASMKFRTINIGFTYDVDGLRTSKTVHNVDLEHKYYYVGNRLQYETISDSSALWYFYDADGNPSGIRYKDHNGTVNDYYFVCNWRGDVIQIYNASGTLVGSYTYDAWGKVTENATSADTQNITETNPIRYRGYYYDTETRLYYLKSRYYDPAVKRFLNVDGLVSTSIEDAAKNMFAYCTNNPVFYSDSEGNCKYKANSYDFYRMNHGLSAAGCTCGKEKKKAPKPNIPNPEESEEKAFAAMESVSFFLVDGWIDSLLSGLSINSIATNVLLEGVKNLSGLIGIASAMNIFVQISWDFFEYGKNDRDFFVAAGIDVGCTFIAAGIGAVLLSGAPIAAVAVGSVFLGYISANVSNEMKRKYIN